MIDTRLFTYVLAVLRSCGARLICATMQGGHGKFVETAEIARAIACLFAD